MLYVGLYVIHMFTFLWSYMSFIWIKYHLKTKTKNRGKLKCKFRLRTPKSEEGTRKLLLYQWTNKKALWLLEAELSIDWHCRTDGWFSPRTCRIAALTLSLVKKQNLTCPFSRNFAKLRHKKMHWFLLFIRIANAGEYKYFISLESLGGGQRDSMKNWIFKIPDFCLKLLSPVTFTSRWYIQLVLHKNSISVNTRA